MPQSWPRATSTRPLTGRGTAKNSLAPPVGAAVALNALTGLTAERLQTVVDCHLARNAAVGHEMPEMPYCPLVPRGAAAKVRAVDGGFAVDIRAEDPNAAAEIWRRAQALDEARSE